MMAVRSFAPGRVELAGNHTDHQGGRAIAAAVDCGIAMEVRPASGSRARVESEGFDTVDIDLADEAPIDAERLTTAALVRGVVAGLRRAGCPVQGFDAQVESDIPAGGGLSSSAAFELALACALEALYAEGPLAPEQRAFIGQEAERGWFGKPCGLLDQLAIALGGAQVFDFAESVRTGAAPRCAAVPFNPEQAGYALCLVDTRCDHSRYAREYAQVTLDMQAVAQHFGRSVLSEVSEETFLEGFADVRGALGDMPALRALHYYREMHLVDQREQALRRSDFEAFLQATRLSGASSAQYLQNVSTFDRTSQPALATLAAVDQALGGRGACRIHGGGFGGTVQAFVPTSDVQEFIARVEQLLGAGVCRTFGIAEQGARASWL